MLDLRAEHGIDRSAVRAMPTIPELAFRVFLPRERDHEYESTTSAGRWIIRTNWQAPNFRLRRGRRGREAIERAGGSWSRTGDDAFIARLRACSGISSRSRSAPAALRKIRIRPWDGGKDFVIAADEPAYTDGLGAERGARHATVVRYTTPR